MNNITVTQLKYLNAVAAHGGFSRAASHVNISQPALTRHIKALEEECGVLLLQRTPNGVVITQEGRRLLDAAEQVFAGMEAVNNIAASFTGAVLRIRSVSTPKLVEFIKLCRKAFHGIEIDFAICNAREVLDALNTHRAEIGFLTMPEGAFDLDISEIGRYTYNAYVGTAHEWADRSAISITELNSQRMIVPSATRRSRQVFEDHMRRHGVEPVISQEVASIETIWHLAQQNMGVGVLSDNGYLISQDIVRLDFIEEIAIPLHMVARQRDQRSKLANAAFRLGRHYLDAQVSETVKVSVS